MQSSPLQLENYFLQDLAFSLKDPIDKPDDYGNFEKIENPEISVTVNIESLNNGKRWRCLLKLETTGESSPYSFKLTYIGFFRVDTKFPKEHLELMVKTNAPAILYSAARETLVSLTGRSPFPTIVLPSVTFLQPLENPDKSKKVASKSRKSSSVKG